jgi:manganese efflux pump family protein
VPSAPWVNLPLGRNEGVAVGCRSWGIPVNFCGLPAGQIQSAPVANHGGGDDGSAVAGCTPASREGNLVSGGVGRGLGTVSVAGRVPAGFRPDALSRLTPKSRLVSPLEQYPHTVLALLLVAAAIGLDNFAVAVGIGLAGTSNRTRLRVGVVFGAFEAGMPVIGLLLGHRLVHTFGHTARWVGAGLLMAAGIYGLASDLLERESRPRSSQMGLGRLIVTALALSIDNLVIGFALGTYRVGILVASLLIGAVSVALSLVGLELGARLGERSTGRSELVGSGVLILVGLAIGLGIL